MQLRNARLCLDCEEVHDAPQCPACASETFAFITRWVPAPERRTAPRVEEPPSETLDTYRQLLVPDAARRSSWRFVKGGAAGLALLGVAGWMWKNQSGRARPDERDASDKKMREN
jgi:hypothetical protein